MTTYTLITRDRKMFIAHSLLEAVQVGAMAAKYIISVNKIVDKKAGNEK